MQLNDQFNDRELAVLLRALHSVLHSAVEGDVVELGCYKGLTAVQMQKAIIATKLQKKLYLYDSFAGLPQKSKKDASPAGMQFIAGELPASKAEVITLFKKAALPVPFIKKSWFHDLSHNDLPAKICFAFLDGDFYESITDSLGLVWPRLSPGAAVIVDDYQNEALPGAQKAVDEWLQKHPARFHAEASLAIISV